MKIKVLSIAAAVSVLFAFSACGGAQQNQQENQDSATMEMHEPVEAGENMEAAGEPMDAAATESMEATENMEAPAEAPATEEAAMPAENMEEAEAEKQ
ncbi:MAG: hypothetical protein CSA07_00935 [Bacteroidia bacterium]|nr:MAG: hypothetical protein CSA07_00935 [Bacteroidia bacterium]